MAVFAPEAFGGLGVDEACEMCEMCEMGGWVGGEREETYRPG